MWKSFFGWVIFFIGKGGIRFRRLERIVSLGFFGVSEWLPDIELYN